MWADGLTTRHLFFTGKGGVGKTSLACATAMHLAEQGQRTLIVSTDPASNLDEVFGVTLGTEPTAIASVPNLFGANLDPEAAAAAYRETMVGPYRGKLPEAVIRNMEEQFSGACTTEIAAFDEFVRLMADPDATANFDHIVFDTAPTGHTLRLLSLPSAWSGYLNTTTAESSCLGPLAGLKGQRELYESAFRHLSDPASTTVVLVARADRASLKEAARTQDELAELDIRNLRLVINAVYESGGSSDPVAQAFAEVVATGLSTMPAGLSQLSRHLVPMLPGNVVGLDALRGLLHPEIVPAGGPNTETPPDGQEFCAFVDAMAQDGHGVIMTMGKGGVGKTSVAVRIATALAARGHQVLLTTTDPAGNVLDLVGDPTARLEVSRISPEDEVKKYTAAALAKAAESMDADGLALLAEDLRSPCTEEIAVFRAFADTVAQGEDRFVVIDTAPTGHTILLMDATEAYHREVARTQSDAPESVRQLLPRLREPHFTKVVLVTLPEPTPVHEAMRLRDDLKRAGIVPFGWVVNRSLALTGVTEPILAGKAAKEIEPLREIMALGEPFTILPWVAQPVGALQSAGRE
ncbi:MAG TPA: arsenical pump-driving ATPase [Armatimonadetes bacterium]|nr:arsenical pump-driving ATPase [Armatimonadota bacterium]HCM74094.1 arsenical pump-driving ATPase [Armatimonadota bacterium]HRE92712.1 arsenical pump-driving ATPase [Fimbriimonadaceae bacterium]